MVNPPITRDGLLFIIHDELGAIAPDADLDSLPPFDDIRETLDIDSFDFLNFLIALNERTGVEIPESDYGKLGSLNDILSYVSARL